MAIGPVQYMVVAFPGNKFKGDIAPALGDLVDKGLIRIIDLAFILKDADGNITGGELEDAGSEVFQAFQAIVGDRGHLVSEEDLLHVGEQLEPNSSAALLVWEDLWATELKTALQGAGGVLVDIQRIPADIVDAAVEWDAENRAEAATA